MFPESFQCGGAGGGLGRAHAMELARHGARVVVNASGPWTDLTNTALGEPTRYMGGTKGSHIVVDHPELLAACNGRECGAHGLGEYLEIKASVGYF